MPRLKHSGQPLQTGLVWALLAVAFCGCPQEPPPPPPPVTPPPPPPPKFQSPLPEISADWPPVARVGQPDSSVRTAAGLPPAVDVNWDGVAESDVNGAGVTWQSIVPAEAPESQAPNSRTYDIGLPFRDVRQTAFTQGEPPLAVILSSDAQGSTARSGLGHPARLDVFNLNSGQKTETVEMPDFAILLDVSPGGTWAVVRHTNGQSATSPDLSQTRIDIYSLTNAQPSVGWAPFPTEGEPQVPVAARFVDDEHLLVLGHSGDVVFWKVPDAQPVYRLSTGAAQGSWVLTPDRKFAAVATLREWIVFDTSTGAVIGKPAFPGDHDAVVQGAAISPAGDQLAAVLALPEATAVHWDLATGQATESYPVPSRFSGSERPADNTGLQWVAPNLLLYDRWLIDPARKSAVWRLPYAARTIASYRGADLRHWGLVPNSSGATGSLVAWQIPDRNLQDRLATVAALPQPQYGAGTRASLGFELEGSVTGQDDFEKQMRRIIARKLEQVGWLLDDSAPTKVVVKIGSADAADTPAPSDRSDSTIISSGDFAAPSAPPVTPNPMASSNPHTTFGFEIRTGGAQPAHIFEGVVVATEQGRSRDDVWSEVKRRFAQEIVLPGHVFPVAPELLLSSTNLFPDPAESARRAIAVAKIDELRQLSQSPTESGTSFLDPHDDGVITIGMLGGMRDYLVTLGSDDIIKLWNPQDAKMVQSTTDKAGIELMITPGDGRRVVFSTDEGRVRIYDVGRRNVVSSKSYDGEQITALGSATGAQWVVSGTSSGKVQAWLPGSADVGGEFSVFPSPVVAVAVMPQSGRFAAVDEGGSVKIGELARGTIIEELPAYGQVTSLLATSDERYIAMGTVRHGVQFIDAEDFHLVREFDDGHVTHFTFSADGKFLFIGLRHGGLHVWDIAKGNPTRRLTGLGSAVTGIGVSADGDNVAASSADNLSLFTWGLGPVSTRPTRRNGNNGIIRSGN